MSINLTPILQALIGLLAALITYRLIPWIKARTTNEQQAIIRAVVKTAVFAAEQLYQGERRGHEKMEYVKTYLAELGYDVDVTAIEAAVSEYLNPPATISYTADIPPDEE